MCPTCCCSHCITLGGCSAPDHITLSSTLSQPPSTQTFFTSLHSPYSLSSPSLSPLTQYKPQPLSSTQQTPSSLVARTGEPLHHKPAQTSSLVVVAHDVPTDLAKCMRLAVFVYCWVNSTKPVPREVQGTLSKGAFVIDKAALLTGTLT